MSGMPSHKVFVVEDREEGEPVDEDNKPFWTRVGAAWPHKDGKGLNIQLAHGLSVSGRVVLRELHREGSTICMVTHDPRYADYADRQIRLFDGRIVDENTLIDLSSRRASAV